jgi:iron-sulfur cluster repair protein YtfE (RIC family)
MTRRRILVIAAVAGTILAVTARTMGRTRAKRRPAHVAFMHSMHAAMRRDLRRLRAALARADGLPMPVTVREGFEELRRELEFHHHAEDDDLWPVLRERAGEKKKVDAAIDEMVEEHAQISPALDRVSRALDGIGRLADAVEALDALVTQHLDHEERTALPLVERYLNDAEWHDFLHTERRKRPASERPTFLAWVLDDAPPADADAVLRELPPPGRFVYQRVLKPRYDARQLWSMEGERAKERFAQPAGAR